MNSSHASPANLRSELFGNYKAEWLGARIFELFTQPAYFPELETFRPCVLVGGRGTGKTTVLRSLSYEGRFAFSGDNEEAIKQWAYYGLYYRVDTNRVTAFRGEDLTEENWSKLFAHYMNLILCEQALNFLIWYHSHHPEALPLKAQDCRRVAISLNVEQCSSILELVNAVDVAKLTFEAYLNNLSHNHFPKLSLQGAPVDVLLSSIAKLPHFKGKHFFFLIDEYENFEDYQQVVVNTLIKHAGSSYCFKVGVRELGWRKRNTLNANEQLNSPADYVRVAISEKLSGDLYERFASDICNQRLSQLRTNSGGNLPTIEQLLPGLTEEQEAERLGVSKKVQEEIADRSLSPDVSARLLTLRPLEAWMVLFWAESQKKEVETVLEECEAGEKKWKTRFENYRHAILFSIRSKKTGIRKYFVGWQTFLLLSNNNIRYLLELVDQTIVLQEREETGKLGDVVPPATQTSAAEYVGRKNLTELEGLSVHGSSLTRLVLGLGRIFQVLAQNPSGHAPEVNQFHLTDGSDCPTAVNELLKSSVMHLALVRTTANKLSDQAELKDYDYALHPIFSPFFVFSYRKKRKMNLSPSELLGLIEAPVQTIKEILKADSRSQTAVDLPEQLQLFEAYYGNRP